MVLSDIVNVSSRFQRSVQIDSDFDDADLLRSFVCPQSSAEVLLRLGFEYSNSQESAFTLTGPYGSGKSSLVVLLSALLGEKKDTRALAKKSLGQETAGTLLKQFNVDAKSGWKFLPVVGTRASAEKIVDAQLRTMFKFPKKSKAKTTLELIEDIVKQEQCGLLMVFDEMGKFLEAATEYGGDIYFFQQLAELANRSNGKLIILGVLHQAFAEYARRLGRDTRDEWFKIQGRFADLPLNIAGEEVIELIGKAIQSSNKPQDWSPAAKATATHIAERRPTQQDILTSHLNQCWPLHPVTGALLGPISRRRFGQNQRSVFAFLNSSEPEAFQDFLRRTEFEENSLYSPSLLWDYLQLNLEPSIMASPDGHRWALAVDAVTRTRGYTDDERVVNLVKCIALIDLFRERSGLAADRDLLVHCISDTEEMVDSALNQLESWSIIVYREYYRAFSLYEGSDFDIEEALDEAEDQDPVLDFTRIRSAANFQPIIAKEHYHSSGAIRWMEVDVVPSTDATEVISNYAATNGAFGLYLVVMGSEDDTPLELEQLCLTLSLIENPWPILISPSQNSRAIRTHSREIQSLEWIRENNPELGGDTTARKEVDFRSSLARTALLESLETIFTRATWYDHGTDIQVQSRTELHRITSGHAERLFNGSPHIRSELVNRHKPSSNSNGALKALMKAMIEKGGSAGQKGEERLGIKGYPAEGGLFDTLLKDTGLYQNNVFCEPKPTDSSRLHHLWLAADACFDEHPSGPVPLETLYQLWSAPPYGVKAGLLPFLAIAYILTRVSSLAVYLERVYRPYIDDLFIDVLVKVPRDISLRRVLFSDIHTELLKGITSTLNDLHPENTHLAHDSEPLRIAQALVGHVIHLPPWVLRTNQLSPATLKFRDIVKNANDPNRVLFEDLPSLLHSGHIEDIANGEVQPIIDEISAALGELSTAYDALIADLRAELMMVLDMDNDDTPEYEHLRANADVVEQVSGELKLTAFATRLKAYSGEVAQIEGIAGLAADKPMWQWVDHDVKTAKTSIASLAKQFMTFQSFGYLYQRNEFINARKLNRKNISAIKESLSNALSLESDPELALAALADLGRDIIESIKQREQNSE